MEAKRRTRRPDDRSRIRRLRHCPLVHKSAAEMFKQRVGDVYEQTIGYAPSFYVAEIADGAKKLMNQEV